MKKLTKIYATFAAVAVLAFTSCEKERISSDNSNAISQLNALAVTADSTSDDAIFIINTCARGSKRDSITFSALPTGISTYLTMNYSGYTFKKALKVATRNEVQEGFIVVVEFEGKPVGLKFDNTGAFVKVLEQRERRDLLGKGWRPGGRFDCRDGKHKDTIALSAIPAAIKTYITTNYPMDTLLHASSVKDGSVIVLTTNNGHFANIFKVNSSFVKRIALPAPHGKGSSIAETSLPSNIKNYLIATYPAYVFTKAFIVKSDSIVKGYVVMIDANATKYVIHFDELGNFVKNIAVK